MYKFTPHDYTQLAEKLTDSLTSLSLYSGSIEIENDIADIKLTATLLLHFRQERFPEGEISQLDNITPIWLEVQTTTLDGIEFNDFDFAKFKEVLCQ